MAATPRKVNILRRLWIVVRSGRDPVFEHTYLRLDRIEADLRALDEYPRD